MKRSTAVMFSMCILGIVFDCLMSRDIQMCSKTLCRFLILFVFLFSIVVVDVGLHLSILTILRNLMCDSHTRELPDSGSGSLVKLQARDGI